MKTVPRISHGLTASLAAGVPLPKRWHWSELFGLPPKLRICGIRGLSFGYIVEWFRDGAISVHLLNILKSSATGAGTGDIGVHTCHRDMEGIGNARRKSSSSVLAVSESQHDSCAKHLAKLSHGQKSMSHHVKKQATRGNRVVLYVIVVCSPEDERERQR